MIYSYRIEQAIRAAAVLHKDQRRKGKAPLPYVSHLIAVAFLTADYTDDEDTIVAALLHDTLEDTEYTAEELRKDFGPKVVEVVRALSEPEGEWAERKKAYAKQLSSGPEEALIVAAADKIHNLRCTIEDYYSNHDRFFRDFGGTLRERMMAYQSISNILNRRLKNDIIHEFNHVFEEYKKFTSNVQKETERT